MIWAILEERETEMAKRVARVLVELEIRGELGSGFGGELGLGEMEAGFKETLMRGLTEEVLSEGRLGRKRGMRRMQRWLTRRWEVAEW